MRDLLRGLLDLLLPPACAGCGGATDAEPLCAGCLRRLPRIPPDRCASCQQRPALAPSPRCAPCVRRRGPLLACRAGCWFEGEVAAWIRDFKYPSRPDALGAPDRARVYALTREVLAGIPRDAVLPGALVPVPLHVSRLRARGFNPAAVIARDLARALGRPVRTRALTRVRDTPSQTGLGRRERRRNLRGAFRASRAVTSHVWLVDDVVTTGATLEEAARTLRRAGARRVSALCVARTPPPEAQG